MNKFTLLTSALCMSVSSFAQWTKPEAPAKTALDFDTELYLYNRDADGFFLGANDWGTRASISQTHGHKVYLDIYIDSNKQWDGISYYITNYVEQGNMKDQIGYMFMDALDAIWVDNTKTGKSNNVFTFEDQGEETYKIALSAYNSEFNSTNYPGTYLGIIPEMKDTRIYACDPDKYNESAGYDFDNFKTVWYFVSPADYTSYTNAATLYNAAMALGTMIDSAKTVTALDASYLEAANTVYNNTNSTAEELDNATAALTKAIYDVKITEASLTNPLEMLSEIGGVEQTFTNSETTGWTMATSASNKQATNGNNAKDYSITGNHLENWNGSAFGTGRVYAKVTGIPNGVYRFSTLAFANVTGGTYIYAGNDKKLVSATNIDIEQPTEVMTIVSNGELEFGLSVETSGPNWIGLDNVNLYYLGSAVEAYQAVAEEKIGMNKDYEALVAEEEVKYYCKADYDRFIASKTSLQNSTTAEDITANLVTFESAAAAMDSCAAAYNDFYNTYEEAEAWLAGSTATTDACSLLSDYLQSEEETGFNGNGGATYILGNGTLTAKEIAAEKVYLANIYADALASGMSDGDDCTSILKNPKFEEEGGWTSAVGPTWPTGSIATFPVFEAKNMICDVYQNLTGLQNGLYEMNLEAAFRPGAEDNEENEAVAQAYAYINSFETKIPCVGYGSADEASADFAAEGHPVTVYGLVTDGTMKIGITNKVRSVENCILWGGGVSLTFRAKNADILSKVIDQTIPEAQALFNKSFCGMSELDALEYCIKYSKSEDDLYEALINLKTAMADVETGNEIYNNLINANKNLSVELNASNADESVRKDAYMIWLNTQNYWSSQEYNNKQAQEAIESINKAIVTLKLADINNDEEADSINYTSMIVNPTFDPSKGNKNTTTIEGWTTTAMNGYKENSVSYNKAAFELNQTISGLKKGKYKVKVHTYYRAGYWYDEESYIKNGTETHLTTLYATTADKTFSTPVLNLTEGATTEQLSASNKYYTLSDGRFAPDGTTGSVEYFDAGAYLNELEFSLKEEGSVTIGLSKKETLANDYEVVGAWELWYYGVEEDIPTTPQDEKDVSNLIVNNNFDPDKGDKTTSTIEGWTTSALNGYKQYTASYNRAAIDLYQTLSGLPTGTYKVTVHTYYRAGYWNEEEAYKQNGTETHLTTLYATTGKDTYSMKVKNLTEDASDEVITTGNYYTLSNGQYAPDGTTPTVDYFNAGYYLNELYFYVNNGTVTIGLKKTDILANDYEVVGAWNLYYYGKGNYVDQLNEKATGIGTIAGNAETATPVAYYSVSGTRLDAPHKGINIVKMSNNKVVKVIVK